MARIRSVHPGLFTDEAFVSASPLARLLWIGIWTECDDQGAFEWKPITLKMRLLPVDNADVAALLDELAQLDMVRRYTMDGRNYGVVRNFARFQRPKKPNSTFPIPDEFRTFLGSSAGSSEPSDDEEGGSSPPPVLSSGGSSPPQPRKPPPVPPKAEIRPQMEDGGGRGEERDSPESVRGVQGGAQARRGTRLPPDWQPNLDDRAYAEGLGLDATRIAEAFRDYWHAKAGKDAVKLDWSATWRGWCRREAERGGGGASPRAPPASKADQRRDFVIDLMRRDEGGVPEKPRFDFEGEVSS